MSDPMTNAEVEDILSSIRRLVSEDSRKEKTPAAATPEKSRPVDRLVLTPALRVGVEDTSSEDGAQEPLGEEAEASAVSLPDPDDTVDEAFSRLDGAFDAPVEEAGFVEVETPDATEDESNVMAFAPEPSPHTSPEEDAAEQGLADEDDPALSFVDTPQTFEWVLPDEVEPVGLAETADAAPNPMAQVASIDEDESLAVEDILSEVAEDMPLPEDGLDRGLEPDMRDAGVPSDVMDDVVENSESAAVAFVEDEALEATETPPDLTTGASLGDKIAALETLIARRSDGFEPDDAGADDYAGTDEPAMEWQDAGPLPEDELVADDYDVSEPIEFEEVFDDEDEAPELNESPDADYSSEPEYVEEAAEPQENEADFLASDETLLDEETLRDLIADIVREELQGALGERITRNVRKLVRREIHRALAAQDLD